MHPVIDANLRFQLVLRVHVAYSHQCSESIVSFRATTTPALAARPERIGKRPAIMDAEIRRDDPNRKSAICVARSRVLEQTGLSLNARIDGVETRVGAVETRVDAVVGVLDTRDDTMEAPVDTMETSPGFLTHSAVSSSTKHSSTKTCWPTGELAQLCWVFAQSVSFRWYVLNNRYQCWLTTHFCSHSRHSNQSGTPYNNGIQDMATLMTFVDPSLPLAKEEFWRKATQTGYVGREASEMIRIPHGAPGERCPHNPSPREENQVKRNSTMQRGNRSV